MNKKIWQDKTILITGAGSGIGAALAKLFASSNARLILTDINSQALESVCRELGESVALNKVADVTNKDQWHELYDDINGSIGFLDVLINNAGMTSFGHFNDTSEALFNKVVKVNLDGVVLGCRVMMPLLEKSEKGMIVNLASIFGLITMPLMSPYHTAKFAVRGFTEALKQDLLFSGSRIDVLCVMPGGIKTNIARAAETETNTQHDLAGHFDSVTLTSPKTAAKVIEKGMRKKTFRILIGPDAKLVDVLYKILPTNYFKLSNRLLGVNKLR